MIALVLPLLLAAAWMPPVVCATMPSCPMMVGAPHCTPQGAEDCGASRLTRTDCCGISDAPVSDLVLKAPQPGPGISQPVAPAVQGPVAPIYASSRPARRFTHRPPPGGRDLLSRLQTLLI